MPWLTSCCCGFSVRTGTKAIAVLSLVYSVLGLLMVATFKIERDRILGHGHHHRRGWDSSLRNIHKDMEVLPTLYPSTTIFSTPTPASGPSAPGHLVPSDGDSKAKEEEEAERTARLEVIMTVYAVSVSVNFLVSLSLLAGVRLGQRWLLVPWITWNVLSLLVSQMAVFYAPNKEFSTIPDLFSTVVSVYCILCVVSYFQELAASPAARRQERAAAWSECGLDPASLPDLEQGASSAHLSPRRPHLVVSLSPAPDLGAPPAYPASDAPPVYDPPPPYPGSPMDKAGEMGEVAREVGEVARAKE